jgi:hypothetical protein
MGTSGSGNSDAAGIMGRTPGWGPPHPHNRPNPGDPEGCRNAVAVAILVCATVGCVATLIACELAIGAALHACRPSDGVDVKQQNQLDQLRKINDEQEKQIDGLLEREEARKKECDDCP